MMEPNPRSVPGDNSKDDPEMAALLGDDPEDGKIAAERALTHLKSIIDRLLGVEDEIKTLRGDVKDIMQEAKSAGFDKRGIAEILKMKRMTLEEFEEREAIRETYLRPYLND